MDLPPKSLTYLVISFCFWTCLLLYSQCCIQTMISNCFLIPLTQHCLCIFIQFLRVSLSQLFQSRFECHSIVAVKHPRPWLGWHPEANLNSFSVTVPGLSPSSKDSMPLGNSESSEPKNVFLEIFFKFLF